MDPHSECRKEMEALRRTLEQEERANRELRRVLEELEAAAGTDRLTGAWNRRRFEEAAAVEISLARRRKGPVSLLMLDLDHFKRVNDTWGHGTGDQVLVQTAQLIRGQLRVSDSLVRWGGEEFVVMAPATRLEGCLALGEKIRAAVEAHTFPGVGGLTLSGGGSEYLQGMTLEAWIGTADEALYRAKAEGRNRILAGEGQAGTEAVPSFLELVWDESYACGEGTLDGQHEELFHLANPLFAAVLEHQPPAEVALRLQRLRLHLAQHFKDEGALLRRAGYPKVEEHERIHEALWRRLGELQEAVELGRLDLMELVEFITLGVVRDHLLREDRNFFPWLAVLKRS